MVKTPFKKVVIATDGSDNSKNAVDIGIKIAGSMGASVDAVHVVRAAWETEVDSELRDEAKKIVGYVEEKGNEENVSVEGVILIGNPAEMLIDYAQKKDADLIVMGTKGMSGIKRFMLGSVAENVVRHSEKPVMVVP